MLPMPIGIGGFAKYGTSHWLPQERLCNRKYINRLQVTGYSIIHVINDALYSVVQSFWAKGISMHKGKLSITLDSHTVTDVSVFKFGHSQTSNQKELYSYCLTLYSLSFPVMHANSSSQFTCFLLTVLFLLLVLCLQNHLCIFNFLA